MKNTADEIRNQISRLKTIGEGENLEGDYVDKLKEGADKLKDKLEKTAGRYERVSSKLNIWAEMIEHAQSETAAALSSAKSAEATLKEVVGTSEVDSEKFQDSEEKLEGHQKERVEQAKIQLTKAQKRYDAAVSDYAADAKQIADKIRDIIDDAIEDGLFSGFSNWVEDHIDAIKKTLEVLGYIATILAAVALVIMVVAAFTVLPGGWLLAAGLMMKIGTAITVATAVTHGAMAATGNGGWGDVAFDLIGLVTMKAGTLTAKGVQKGANAARSASVRAGRQEARDLRNKPGVKEKLADFEKRKQAAPSDSVRKALQQDKERYLKSLKPRGVAQQLPRPTPREVLKAGGDREVAANLRFAEREALKRGGDSDTLAAAQKASRSSGLNFAVFTGGTGLDWGDKAVGSSDIVSEKPKWEDYSDLKDATGDKSGMYDAAQ
ncbi:hypothetical protein [Streptomyces sp. bgisy100]|uniref:hypothetical protein n=1 Tax=Streptomyces sp. bgisy100 TaxID=3413783 RepID=UPI003D74267D